MADLSNIKHIVVLMLENRSFDNVFGYLRPWDEKLFEGLDHNPSPALTVNGIAPWTTKPGQDCFRMPNPDPGEKYEDITQQIFGTVPPGPSPTMGGFMANYATQEDVTQKGVGNDIMHCFSRSELPSLTALADNYAVSDMWFASAPCQTWPNRFFVHTGTADGYPNNTLEGAPYQMQTIFNDLPDGVPWKIYFHDMPQSLLLTRLWPHVTNFQHMDQFYNDAAAGNLPGYAFIEPQYYPVPAAPPNDLLLPNDMHPPHNVQLGDALVARVYNAVRSSPNWTSTLLIVTFDEHGGCYDHVVPPPAVPPGPSRVNDFAFDRYGVRVPTLVISPYTAAGTVLRAPPGSAPFDHTSIIRTVRTCFGISTPLSAREACAPDVSAALAAPFDPDHTPQSLKVPTPVITDADRELAQSLAPNALQEALHQFATAIDSLSRGLSIEEVLQELGKQHAADGTPVSGSTLPDKAIDVGEQVRQSLHNILQRFGASAASSGSGGGEPDNVYRGQ